MILSSSKQTLAGQRTYNSVALVFLPLEPDVLVPRRIQLLTICRTVLCIFKLGDDALSRLFYESTSSACHRLLPCDIVLASTERVVNVGLPVLYLEKALPTELTS